MFRTLRTLTSRWRGRADLAPFESGRGVPSKDDLHQQITWDSDTSLIQSLADTDQTNSDADQIASDADQRSQDADEAASIADQLGSDADQTAADRDQESADREHQAHDPVAVEDNLYDTSRQQRQESTTARESATEMRLKGALVRANQPSARDRTAELRDFTADERDRLAASRDAEATRTVVEPNANESEKDALLKLHFENNEAIRKRAAENRARAAEDRRRAAEDRKLAAADRHQALLDLQRAHLDSLTGAYMRELGFITLEHEITRSRRSGEHFVLAFVDVDGLKQINDREGHVVGDGLLKSVVEVLRLQLRSYDPVVRVGGDEFICGLVDTTFDVADRRSGEMRKAVEDKCPSGSITIGLAELSFGDTLDQLIARADADMYARRSAKKPRRPAIRSPRSSSGRPPSGPRRP
jgi:diguanylate cyclase (GGDEF)-like protein